MCPFINLAHDSVEKSWEVITEMTVGIVIRTVVSSGAWRAVEGRGERDGAGVCIQITEDAFDTSLTPVILMCPPVLSGEPPT